MTFARIGDAPRATALADKLIKDFPVNTIQQIYWQPTIRAEIEVSRNNPDKAIALLQTATPYELGGGAPVGGLYPAFVRGQALLKAHKGSQAAAELRKLTDHEGIVVNLPLGALAHLYLGRAYALEGDSGKAKVAYQDFFSLWKEADPDMLCQSCCLRGGVSVCLRGAPGMDGAFVISPCNPFLSNLYLGHDRMTMDKRGSP